MKIFTETDRLILREILPSDVDDLFELDSDPEVHRYLDRQPVTNKKQIAEVIDFIRQQYLDNGIGRWAVIEKHSNEFLGWSGLKFVTELTNNHRNYYDLGYRLKRKYWGKGFATESARASLKYAFEKLKVNEVYAMADCDNIASDRVLKKAGLTFIESFDSDSVRHNWYRIRKSDFSR